MNLQQLLLNHLGSLPPVMIPDWSKVSEEIIERLKNGTARINNGVIYSNDGNILCHINMHSPTKEELQEIVSSIGGKSAAFPIVASTSLILAALIIQTAFLTDKINKVQETVEKISSEIKVQNDVHWIEKFSSYFGTIKSAAILLRSKDADTNQFSPLLNDLIKHRQRMFVVLPNLLNYISTNSTEQSISIINFTNVIIEAVPFSIYAEHSIAMRLDKPDLAEKILSDGLEGIKDLKSRYREWLNDYNRQISMGRTSGAVSHEFFEMRPKILEVLQSELPEQLLLPERTAGYGITHAIQSAQSGKLEVLDMVKRLATAS